jgi:hypothetical protein
MAIVKLYDTKETRDMGSLTAMELYRSIACHARWIGNICDDYTDHPTMKSAYIAEFREAIENAYEEGEIALRKNDLETLSELCSFISLVHDDAINRTQPRYVMSSKEEFEAMLTTKQHEISHYGFYKNGSGFINIRSYE